jgi:L-lactate dehydrogenase complex protein LldG
MTTDTTDAAGRDRVLGRFRDRLDDFDVSHTTVDPDGVSDAVEAVLEPPAIGVDLPEGRGELPPGVTTAWSPADLRGAATGVTPASLGIADYGSLVLPTTADGVEPVSLFADRHVAVGAVDDVVGGMASARARLGDRFRADRGSAIVATGPSATADMGALVQGAHGPKAVHAIIVRS